MSTRMTAGLTGRSRTVPGLAAVRLAGAETRLLFRDKTTLLSATLIPLAIAFLMMNNRELFVAQAAGSLAATQLMLMLSFSTYASATMSLAGRRKDLFLKRLRNSPLSTPGIVTGLSLPLFAITVLQVVAVLAMVGATLDSVPDHPELLVLALLIGGVLSVAFAFLTAAYTRSPEAAQMTVLPLVLLLVIAVFWTLSFPADQVAVPMLLLPGAGIVQLARLGWDGAPSGELVELLTLAGTATACSLVTTVVGGLIAARVFRWEPRN